MKSTSITDLVLDKAHTYESYNELIESLFIDQRTTNEDNSESNLNYTKLNIQRTSRWDKRGKLDEELISLVKNISSDQIWLVITEGWCGDSGQVLPFINKIAELNDHIDLKFLLRDENPEVMDEFLTDGSRSIPKLIILDKESLNVLGSWGPRPSEVQMEYLQKKRDPNYENKKATEELHLWYARNKGKAIQQDLKKVIEKLV
jgi:hypothetical protein